MTDLPDAALAALAAEETMLAHPWAEVFDACNRPPEPMAPTELAAMIEQSMRDMWSYAGPGGAPSFSWWRRPPRRFNLFRPRGAMGRQLEISAWQELGRSAWIEGVRERLQSAVYAASSGYSWTWTAPGVFGVPGLPESMRVWDASLPWRPSNNEEAQDA